MSEEDHSPELEDEGIAAAPSSGPGPGAVFLTTFGVALLLRLLYVWSMRSDIIFELPIMDAAVHDGWARGELRLFVEGVPYFRAPLYIWFLQLVQLVDPGYLAPRLAQALLSALTVGVVADLGRRLAGPRAGLVGGLLLALCWPAIYFSGELLIVTFFMALVVAALWLLFVGTERDRPGWVLAGALVLGLSSIARPTSLTLLPALAALPWVVWRHRPATRLSRLPRWRAAGVLVVLTLLPGLGLTVRNQVVGDDWVFIASQGGVNFYIGNNADSDGRTAVVPGTSGTWLGGYRDTIRMAEEAEGRPLRPSEVSAWFARQGLREWVEHPRELAGVYLTKLRYLLGAAERPNNKNIHFWRDRSWLLRQPLFTSWSVLFALGVVGIFLLPDRRRAFPLWAFLLLYALGLLPFFINERFRLPLTIGLAVFAGVPIAHAMAAIGLRRMRLALVALAPVLILFTLSQLDRLDFRDDRLEADAFSRYTVGNLHVRAGQNPQALRSYREALEIARRFRLRNFEEVERMLRQSMIEVLLDEGRLSEAQQHLRMLESKGASTPAMTLLRAEFHLRRHEIDAARPRFQQILEVFPEEPRAVLGLAWCNIHDGAHHAALRGFRRHQELVGQTAQNVAGVGVAELLGNENVALARRLLERAIEMDPGTAPAHQFLGEIHRREGDVSRMLYHLRQALRLDPHNTTVQRFLDRVQEPSRPPE